MGATAFAGEPLAPMGRSYRYALAPACESPCSQK